MKDFSGQDHVGTFMVEGMQRKHKDHGIVENDWKTEFGNMSKEIGIFRWWFPDNR